uniref:Uncharacterized protein n=1 Tax=Moniliophthora roreri TaxID=221103 RepID=A0A0W0FMQ7_MONRR
MCGTAKVAD